MLKKELEESLKKIQDDYDYLQGTMNEVKNRVWQNISYIDEALKVEKNKTKKKMLQGLRDEFQFIYNKLDLNELPF